MSNELEHHGILGMKWGVRRTPEQLGHPAASQQEAEKGMTSPPKASAKDTPKKASAMTDEELRAKINRLNMERQYRDLEASLNPKKKSVVKKLLGEAVENLGRKTLSSLTDMAISKVFNKQEKEYSLAELDEMDIRRMSPSMLKKAADAYGAGGKVNTIRALLEKKSGADNSQASKSDAVKPQTSEFKPEHEPTKKVDAQPETQNAKAEPTSSNNPITSNTPSSTSDKGMSFVNRYLYNKSGADNRREQAAYTSYNQKREERVNQAVMDAQRRLDKKRRQQAENDMRRLGL